MLEVVVNVSAQNGSGSELIHGMLLFNKGILLCFFCRRVAVLFSQKFQFFNKFKIIPAKRQECILL